MFFYERLLFQGSELPSDHQFEFDFQYEEIYVESEEHAVLHGLLLKSEAAKGLIIYFHGNRGHLERWGRIGDDIRSKYPYDVLVMDYRGYGKSKGRRSEELLFLDATRIYDYAKSLGYENIIIHGRSLGTGIATYLATQRDVAHLILETPMTSIRDVIPKLNFLLLFKSSLKYEFNSQDRITEITTPITIFHGTDDAIVPYELGYELYLQAKSPDKKIITIKAGKHNNLDTFESYQQAMERILN